MCTFLIPAERLILQFDNILHHTANNINPIPVSDTPIYKTWSIPEAAQKPERLNKRDDTPKDLLSRLRAEKAARLHGGIYHKVQIDLTYNSNHIEGSRLTHDQTRLIFETNTIGGRTRCGWTTWWRRRTISSAST